MKFSAKQIVSALLSSLNDRQRDILESRYGLVKQDCLTLAAIGDKYGITREGIRRIEAQALDKIRPNADKPEVKEFVKLVASVLRSTGGVRHEAELVKDLAKLTGEKLSEAILINYLRFVLEVGDAAKLHKDDKHFNDHWYLSKEDREKAVRFIDGLSKNLKNGNSAKDVKSPLAATYVSISKKFATNAYGNFGLADSREIVPKGARDWAYLILKQDKKPMHFVELAERVNKLQNKDCHPQTVHNELIKDNKFVLVGKGIYALREHGYEPGVAWEVIHRLLKKNGPLHSHQVVEAVNKERFFKRNTILINLQNRKYFKRAPDGRYATLV